METFYIRYFKNKEIFCFLFFFESVLLLGFRADLLFLPLLYFLIKSIWDKNYNPDLSILLSKRIFLVILIVQSLAWFSLIFVKYFSISYNIYDTGNFAHLIFNISSGRGFYNYILQMPAWADHFTPNLAFFAPLFWLDSTFLWLPIARLMAYIVCMPILWKISEFYLHDKKLRYFVLFLWLINYPLFRMLNFEFQPSNLAPPFLLLAFYFYLRRYYFLFTLDLLLLLGFKEHMALGYISIGLWLFFFEKKRKIGTLISVAGIIAGLTIVYLLTPYLSGGISSQQLGKFGPFEIFPQKIRFIFMLFLYVGFLPLLNPKTLLFILPASGISLISNVPAMFTLNFHYHDLPASIIFIGVILGLSAWERKNGWFFHMPIVFKKLALLIALSCIIFYNNHHPARTIRHDWPTKIDLEIIEEVRQFKKEINRQRTLWTLDSLGVYFIEIPYIRSIQNIWMPLDEKKPHYVLLADNVNQWPIEKDYSELKKKIEEAREKNLYEKIQGFNRLNIYRSN